MICGQKAARDAEDEIFLYAVGGLPIEDVAWAHDCYERAVEGKIGVSLNLWEQPEL